MALLTIETNGRVRDLAEGISLGEDWISDTVDFTRALQGSLHVKWSDNDANNGNIVLEASLVDEDEWFDEVENTSVVMNNDGSRGNRKTVLYSHETLGHRLIRVRYYSNGNTAGTMDMKVCGKGGYR